MHTIGAAVLGAGFIGPVHVEALRRLGVNVVGILGVDEEESKQAAETLHLPKAYASLDEVLS
ncbi:MAG: Gfo/Idh/MocA family oxidoreductase, partial [Candidatus Brocadiia bacterium]